MALFESNPTHTSPLPELSRREHDILALLLRGCTNKDMAARLSISVFTVKNHLRHIYEKLRVHSRTEVMLRFLSPPAAVEGSRVGHGPLSVGKVC